MNTYLSCWYSHISNCTPSPSTLPYEAGLLTILDRCTSPLWHHTIVEAQMSSQRNGPIIEEQGDTAGPLPALRFPNASLCAAAFSINWCLSFRFFLRKNCRFSKTSEAGICCRCRDTQQVVSVVDYPRNVNFPLSCYTFLSREPKQGK